MFQHIQTPTKCGTKYIPNVKRLCTVLYKDLPEGQNLSTFCWAQQLPQCSSRFVTRKHTNAQY